MRGINTLWLSVILLFSCELFSPLYYQGLSGTQNSENTENSFSAPSSIFTLFDFLAFEENCAEGAQKDEGKKVFCFIDFKSVEIFNELEKFKSLHSLWLIRKEKPNALPSLLALHCKLLI
jgi:hypothetical protein